MVPNTGRNRAHSQCPPRFIDRTGDRLRVSYEERQLLQLSMKALKEADRFFRVIFRPWISWISLLLNRATPGSIHPRSAHAGLRLARRFSGCWWGCKRSYCTPIFRAPATDDASKAGKWACVFKNSETFRHTRNTRQPRTSRRPDIAGDTSTLARATREREHRATSSSTRSPCRRSRRPSCASARWLGRVSRRSSG